MTGKELIELLTALIEEHGDLLAFDDTMEPFNLFHYVKAQDSEEGFSSVHGGTGGDSPMKASEVIAAYKSARDQSGSNESDPWDDLYITTASDSDVGEPCFLPEEDGEPACFQFE